MNVVKQWETNSNLQFRDAFHNLFLVFSGQIGVLFIAGLYIYIYCLYIEKYIPTGRAFAQTFIGGLFALGSV
jgi:hypothetical protein